MADSSSTTTSPTAFDPGRYLTRINNGDYLEVKWRLVWLREAHPDASVETELHRFDDTQAVFKATVTIPGGGSATGWGSESPGDFRDFLEKAETKALGRALAALGFGTQFCPDFEFGAAQQRVVDAPIRIDSTRGGKEMQGGRTQRPVAVAQGDTAPTPRQMTYLQNVTREAGMNAAELNRLSVEKFGLGANELDRRQTSQLIEHVKTRGAHDTELAS